MYVKDTALLKQKKRFVLDITGFVFNMSSQVKVDVSNANIYELYWYYFSCLFYTLCLLYSYLGVPSFDFERIWWRLLRIWWRLCIWWRLLRIWWRLFKKRVVRTKCFYYYHCFDTSAGGLLVSSGNIQPVVSVTITVSIPLLVDY